MTKTATTLAAMTSKAATNGAGPRIVGTKIATAGGRDLLAAKHRLKRSR
jgi:hypothetical protein